MHLSDADINLDFQPQKHVTSRISQDHSLYQVCTLWNSSSYVADKQINNPRLYV